MFHGGCRSRDGELVRFHEHQQRGRQLPLLSWFSVLLEPYAAFLAATRGGQALLEQLETSNRSMAAGIAEGDAGIAKVQMANRDFHHALLEASGSPRLRAMLITMIDMPIIKRSFYIYTPQELEQSLHHHRDLTLAVKAQDGELARQVMQLHLRMSYHRFMIHRDEYQRDSAPC